MELTSGGFVTGVNYWCSSNAMEMWRRWDASAVDADFAALARNGCRLVRCFTRWDDFQPITMYRTHAGGPGGRLKEFRHGDEALPETETGAAGMSETMLEHFEEFCDLAAKHGLKLIVALLTGQMTFGLFVPPGLTGLDLYHDPVALKWEYRFVHCLVTRMKHHPAIWAWESGNESNFLGGSLTREGSWAWTRWIHSAIREADPSRPVIGVSVGGIAWDSRQPNDCWMIEDQAELSDYLTVHPYGMGTSVAREPYNEIRQEMFAVARCRVSEDVGGKPCFVEETGLWRPIAASKRILGEAARGMMWNQWANGCRGMLWWCAFDQDCFDMAPYDWNEPGLEHGIMTAQRENMPIADSMRDFAAMQSRLPFAELPGVVEDAVCLVGDHEQAMGAWILARQAGVNLRFQSPSQPLRPSPVYFLPSCRGRNFLTTRRWESLLDRVREGATLYLGLDDTYLTHLEEVTGVGVTGRWQDSQRCRLTVSDFAFELTLPVRYEFELEGAEVLGCDDGGRPQFFMHRYGKGLVYTLGFPLERLCMQTVGLFRSSAWRLYRALVPKDLCVTSGNCLLTITEHPFGDGRMGCVLVNNSSVPVAEELTLGEGWTILEHYSDCAACGLCGQRLSLPANGGMLLLLSRGVSHV